MTAPTVHQFLAELSHRAALAAIEAGNARAAAKTAGATFGPGTLAAYHAAVEHAEQAEAAHRRLCSALTIAHDLAEEMTR